MRSSVIVAAHNEESVIGRTLSQLLAQAEPGEFDVVVICNGCDDRTTEVARGAGPDVRVLEIGQASKIAALRRGDQEAECATRIYLDADVVLETDGARQLVEALHRPGVLAAAPTIELDASRSSMLVRSYFRIWSQLPSIRAGLAGRGVYAVSSAGRGRFDEFPDVLADDLFMDQLFSSAEQEIVEARSIVIPPATTRALVDRKTRVFIGNRQLASRTDLPVRRRSGSNLAWLDVVRRSPLRLMDVPAYLGVTIISKVRGLRGTRSGAGEWGRDETSRQGHLEHGDDT